MSHPNVLAIRLHCALVQVQAQRRREELIG
jgi:hypothetical protein